MNWIEFSRKCTRFLLASFLWLHALFLWNPQTRVLAALSRYTHLTLSEVMLFVLLLAFTIFFSAGWWSGIKSAVYVYCFPFVVVAYLLWLIFLLLKAVNAWISHDQRAPQDRPYLTESIVLPNPPAPPQQSITAPQAAPAASAPQTTTTAAPKKKRSLFSVITRPFRRFTVLWCVLLLLATHRFVLWLSLVVVAFVLVMRTLTILRMTIFTRSWIEKAGTAVDLRLRAMLEMLAHVTPTTEVTKELKDLWQQLGLWDRVARFLSNRNLLSRWAAVLVGLFYACIYIYIALLFSFIYFGIARVSGVTLSWSGAAVDAMFIPVYATDLPKTVAMRFVGGLEFTLIVTLGVGTFWNYLRKRLDSVYTGAVQISGLLAGEAVRQQFKLLEAKVKPPAATGDKGSPKTETIKETLPRKKQTQRRKR